MKYPGVRYRDDGEPLNDLERIIHSHKAEADLRQQSAHPAWFALLGMALGAAIFGSGMAWAFWVLAP